VIPKVSRHAARQPKKVHARRVVQLEKQIKQPSPWRPYQERFLNDPARRRLWVKSAQIGGSTTLAAWATSKCISKPKELVVILSASDRQAKEVAIKAAEFIKALGAVEIQLTETFFEKTDVLEHTVRFPNGARIIALPAKPATARGYTGHVVLDEFAHVQDDEEIFKVAYRQVTLGYDMLVISTPNGQQGRFWRMAKELELDLGFAPVRQPVTKGAWSGHWTDIHLAVQEGLRVNPDEIRSGCDEMTWNQEYLCQFLSENALWLTPELVEAAVSRDANTGPPALYRSALYAGWDVARNGHHSTLWFTELAGDVTWCRGIVNISGMTTPAQVEQARVWMPQVAKMNVDMTGMGMMVAETLMQDYPTRVEGITFTAAIKEQMAVYMRMRLEQRKMRIPNDETIRRSFLSLRRSTNRIGQARFDADADQKFGHADEFWAAAMAEMAAERGVQQVTRGGESSIMFDSQAKGPLSHFMTRQL
jgi:phage FluMu gp28-like protein